MNNSLLHQKDINDKTAPDILHGLLRTIVLIRRFEEKIIEVYPVQDMKTPVHLYIGEEAIAAGVCAHLSEKDYMFTTHRSHGHCLAKGTEPELLYAEFYGRARGCCKGKGGSMHPADPEHGILGTSAIVGGGIPIAAGTALASKMKNEDRVSVVFFGDGASEEGTFHESLNFAALKQLPVVFVCENNSYATTSPISQRQPNDNIAKKAESYGIPGMSADGNDVMDVYNKAQPAILRARNGEGPTLLECKTYRWKGHVGPDCDHEKGCRPMEDLKRWKQRCPVELFKNYMKGKGLLTDTDFERLVEETDNMLEAAITNARNFPMPDSGEVLNDVYFEKK